MNPAFSVHDGQLHAGSVPLARLAEEHGTPLYVYSHSGLTPLSCAGVLLTRVEYLKDSGGCHFAIVDAGMNDLIRPALYQAWMPVEPVLPNPEGRLADWDVVGPVCESGDFIGKGRALALCEGDVLAVGAAGAYGFAMASNYNTRGRPAEVVVDGDRVHLVRARETVADLLALESRLS
ncbi:Diaminopimelate decarboxylase [Diplonema papillatum]|nr:Diaminopimelate decarboxylase [Diplonema papillatum]